MARPKREVPWLDRRGDVYYAFWYDAEAAETRRYSLRTRDGGEAQDRFAAFLTEGIAKPRRDAGLTVRQALDDYWREHVVKKCADPGRQEYAIRHLKAFFGDCQLADVDIPMSRAYAELRQQAKVAKAVPPKPGTTRAASQYVATPVSDSTIRRELNVLVAASKHAKRWKRTSEGVSIELPRETLLGQDDEAPYFTREELSSLFMTADGELSHFITLAYYTGARRRSIEDLTLPQVKWAQRQIVLKPVTKRGTKKRQPIVPILPEMEGSLKRLCEEAPARAGRLFSMADFYEPFRRLCWSLNMGERSHPHLLRHTRATHLLQAGVPIYDVAKLLGDTITTVDRVYGHHSQQRLAAALEGK